MNKKELKFLETKLQELVNNDIITDQQYTNATEYYQNKIVTKSVITIFTAIGVLLLALSIITIFAINWTFIPKGIKTIISFVPLIITSVMLYSSMCNDNKKMKLYTSIFAPVAILATNSLISQIFHIQTEIFELFFLSLVMFMPIVFILRNYLSIIVYGAGTITYSLMVIDSTNSLFGLFLITLPLIIYNVINYNKNKSDKKNVLMWITNIIILTLFIFVKEIFRGDVFIVYMYMIYLITQTLFGNDNLLNKIISKIFTGYLIISCIHPMLLSYTQYFEFDIDTLIVTMITGIFVFLSNAYQNPKEYFIMLFVLIIYYLKIPPELLFYLVNALALSLGIYKIIEGNKRKHIKEIKRGVYIILLLIFFRFMNANISFTGKSILFLISGIGFMMGANMMKKRIGGNDNE